MGKCILKSDEQMQAWYQEQIKHLDPMILALGLSQPAQRALVNLHVRDVEDLKRPSQEALKNAHGIGPKAYRKLESLR
jgi:hypothetical protein